MRFGNASMIAAGILVAAGVVVGGLSTAGFCFEQGRFLNDDELVDIATRYYFRQYPPNAYVGLARKVEQPIAYASHEDFRERNPDCCTVTDAGRKGFHPTLTNRLLGRFAGFVRIEYALEEKPGAEPDRNTVFVAVTNCGIPWNGVKFRQGLAMALVTAEEVINLRS